MTILILKGHQEHEDSFVQHNAVVCVSNIYKECKTFNEYVWRFSISTNIDHIILTSDTFSNDNQATNKVLKDMQARRKRVVEIAFLNKIPKEEIIEI
jgi:hypothetical protein